MNIAAQAVFQALNAGISSLIVSVLRLCIIVLPLAWIFTKFTNAEFMIWFAFPISEGIAMIAAILLLIRGIKSVMTILE
jgi:Na+-driven multidrug efflux pump